MNEQAITDGSRTESKCRSCGEPIWWLCKDGEESGKLMPINQEEMEGGGNLVLIRDGDTPTAYVFVGKEKGTHVTHFATCPQSMRWRKRDPNAGR